MRVHPKFAALGSILATSFLTLVALAQPRMAFAADPAPYDEKLHQKVVEAAEKFLMTKGQAEDGTFTAQAGCGVTSLVVTGLIENGRSPSEPGIAKSLKYLESCVQPDGGIYTKGSRFQNYETCVAMLAFDAANKDGKYDKILKGADGFVRKLQHTEANGSKPSEPSFGGGGYGPDSRPDLSNTSFLVDALKSAGATADDKAMKDALVFVSRCQNLESEYNTLPFAAKNPDGGFYYAPGEGSDDKKSAGLRSYGTMSYAGLKSMIYIGVAKDDIRVKGVVDWLKKNYSVTSNPGMGNKGLYYYYHTFSKALDAYGEGTFTDKDGIAHDWRNEILAELAKRQKSDGSWVNEDTMWLEGDPNLCTAFVLLSLAHVKPGEEDATPASK